MGAADFLAYTSEMASTAGGDGLQALAEAIRAAASGDTDVRLTGPYKGPDGRDLREPLERCLRSIAERTAQFHDSSMDLALG